MAIVYAILYIPVFSASQILVIIIRSLCERRVCANKWGIKGKDNASEYTIYFFLQEKCPQKRI